MPSPITSINGADDGYWRVELGPIPNVPDWHVQSEGTSYPFPSEAAARTFARVHQAKEPNREVRVVPPATSVV
jgi:hypothetical protein